VTRHVVALLALANGVRAAVGYLALDAQLIPDTALYAQGSLGLFPSPIGRLIGLGGVDAIAAANVLASIALVLVVAAIARQVGGTPWVAAAVCVVTPLTWWTMFAAVDTLGVVLLLVGVLEYLRGREVRAGLWAAGACASHLALIPLVAVTALAVAGRRASLAAVAFCGILGGFALWLTPYGGLLDARDYYRPMTMAFLGLTTLFMAVVAFLPFFRRLVRVSPLSPLVIAWAVAVALTAAFMGAEARKTNARYALPLVALMSSASAIPARSRVLAPVVRRSTGLAA